MLIGIITITGSRADNTAKRADEKNKGVLFSNCARFTESISEKSDIQIHHTKDIDVVMPMYNLIEYDNYFLNIRVFMAILQRWAGC